MLDRSRRDVADQVRVLYAQDERSRRRRRSLATLGAFCLLIVALAIAFNVYDQTAIVELDQIDVAAMVASDDYDQAAAAYEEFLVKYPLTTASTKARAELLRIDGLRQKREAELDAQRAATDVERQHLRSDYRSQWRRHRELFQSGRPEEALAVVENVRKLVSRAGSQDDMAWALEEQVDKTLAMLRDFVKKSGDLEVRRAEALAAGKIQDAWAMSVELQKGYEITAAARRTRIPVQLDSRPQGARVLRDGVPLMATVGGKSVPVTTPTILQCGMATENYSLERDGFIAATLTVLATKQARLEIPLAVIPAHRVHFDHAVQTEIGTSGDWVVAGLRNGRLGIASARNGKVLRVVELGGLRDVEGAPVVSGDRAWYLTNEGTLESVRLDTGAMAPGWPIQLPTPSISGLSLRDGRLLYIDRENVVHCIDQASGRTYWSRSLDGAPVGPPVLERRVARVALADGRIVGIDAIDGRVTGTLKAPSGLSTRPLASEDQLWFGCTDNRIRSMDERTGRVLWNVDVGRTPADGEVVVARTAVAVLAAGDNLRLLDRTTGKQLAETKLSGTLVSMRLHGNTLLTVARTPRDNRREARDLLQARDASTLAMLWEYEDEGTFLGGPGTDGTYVGVAGADGDVVLLR
jgi:outer membrane protein assembly factor BamB